jgi:hypothetical protein
VPAGGALHGAGPSSQPHTTGTATRAAAKAVWPSELAQVVETGGLVRKAIEEGGQ